LLKKFKKKDLKMPTLETSKLTTISHHIGAEQNLHPEATGEFTTI
jgi:hypothetical protein